MNFDYSTIQEKFKSLPEEMQYAMTSPSVAEKIKIIANRYGLLLDQMESLFDVTSYVMLGLLSSIKFASTLAKELNINERQAQLIVTDIGKEVFSDIKTSMRVFEQTPDLNPKNNPTAIPQTEPMVSSPPDPVPKIENSVPELPTPLTESKPSHITDLEKAGGFTIEHEDSMSPSTEGVGSDVLRVGQVRERWSPVQQTVVPKGASIPTPKIETVVPPKPPTPLVQPKPVADTVANTVETQKVKEPLADQLLSTLNKPKVAEPIETKKVTPVPPANLPTEEIKKPESAEIKEAIEKAKSPELNREEIPVFNLDSYITKPNKVVESTPVAPAIPSTPTPVEIEKVPTATPAPQPPKAIGFDPYREPVQ